MKNYVSPKEAAKILSVSNDTLRRWAQTGKIKTIRTKGGHRRYFIDRPKTKKGNFIYARVSSKKQKDNLKNQIAFLKNKYPKHILVKDIGSGINFKRRGFRSILEKLFDGDVKEVVVTSEDRFSRFGFELFEYIFKKFNARLISHTNKKTKII